MIPAAVWALIEIASIAIAAYETAEAIWDFYEGAERYKGGIEEAKKALRETIQALEKEIESKVEEKEEVALLLAAAGADPQGPLTRKAQGRGAGDVVINAAIEQKIPFRQVIGLVCDKAANMPVLDLRKKKGLKIQDLPKVELHLHIEGTLEPEMVFALAAKHGIKVVEDVAQAQGSKVRGRRAGALGDAGAHSFFPTKNIGAYGDGGAITTDDAGLAERLRGLRNYGSKVKYVNVERGYNSRLDELQAAVLRARLPRLAAQTARRRAIAAEYRRALPAWLPPVAQVDAGHVYHLFPVRSTERDLLQQHLHAAGIDTLVHYPLALTEQRAFASPTPAPCPVAERAAREVLSLPMRPGLSDADVAAVVEAAHTFQKGRAHA